MNLPIVIDQETKLALVDREHAEEFMKLIDQSRVYLREWLGWVDSTKSVSDLHNFIDACVRQFAAKQGLSTWIWHNDKIVGIMHLREVDWTNRKAMIGYWVGQEYRGRGFCKKACKAMIDFAFTEWKLNRIEIRCATKNIASQAIPKSLGFCEEGLLRQNEWLYDHFVDHVVFGLVAGDNAKATNEVIVQPTLETKRLVLEPFKESDLGDILQYASHPEVTKYLPWETHTTIEDSKKFLNFVRQTTSTTKGKLFFVFAIRLKETDRVIGSVDFKNVNLCCGQTDYALGYEHWNKGIVTEAVEAIKLWAFDKLPDMVRFQAFCSADNTASARVMEKVGMQREGVRRKAFMLKGKLIDLIDYAVVR